MFVCVYMCLALLSMYPSHSQQHFITIPFTYTNNALPFDPISYIFDPPFDPFYPTF